LDAVVLAVFFFGDLSAIGHPSLGSTDGFGALRLRLRGDHVPSDLRFVTIPRRSSPAPGRSPGWRTVTFRREMQRIETRNPIRPE
jgi:hypothetical protein